MVIDETLNAACITGFVVPIIASLEPGFARPEVDPQDSIAASGDRAVLAGVGWVFVAVIAVFAAFHDPVAAVHEAAVLGAVIAAVALLDSLLDMTVSAAS